jgi:transcriptional regulator GlxA family with amidase domain
MAAYPRAQILDVTGPLEVFAIATRLLEAEAARDAGYAVEVVARCRGALTMSSGVRIVAEHALGEVRGRLDTLLVPGGEGVRDAMRDRVLLDWLRSRQRRARRVASVCTGAFVLAEAGLLDGRRVTTHWAHCDVLARAYPALRVEGDRIHVRDGSIYTSAGVTAGMDLALALVEEDHGRRLALAVARQMVLFLKRPGGQSQFSAQLAEQLAERTPLRDLQAWIHEHPGGDLRVERLAERVGMSGRNFARVFARELQVTPARYVERARVEAARRRLEDTADGVDTVAADCGFGSPETMRRAFLRNLRVSPAAYRNRFRRLAPEARVEDAR